MTEKILTLHPEGKQGVNIDRTKYDAVRTAIVGVLEDSGSLTFAQLADRVGQTLGDAFDGSISWYVTTVKLDLEARNIIERVPKSRPQQLRLSED